MLCRLEPLWNYELVYARSGFVPAHEILSALLKPAEAGDCVARIRVCLPATANEIVIALVFHESDDVFDRIAKENSDFVRERARPASARARVCDVDALGEYVQALVDV